ncbi:methyl-accepting chemotaxis protein [Geobacter sp.]|uniref:methyl-accepting chemotaxis protein n=1 Tax=Geobacter sp. TaxID=46610 RepID=UPI002621E3F2|nr:methyl-accepting chemotaxis protein [Geobacter sp.]
MLFTGKLKRQLEEKDAELNVLKQMLDNLGNIVMLCDTTPDNRIFYMNKAAREMMMRHRQELNSGLRGADVATAFEQSIHQFHRDPAKVRMILGKPGELPHRAEIPIGGVTLRTTSYPIWDPAEPGKVRCYMACWDDISAEKSIEERNRADIDRKNYLEERVAQIAAAMEEMSMTVTEVARNTSNASDSAINVARTAHEGQEIVNRSVQEMQRVARIVRDSAAIVDSLGSKSEKIGEIIEVINEIADQTNLLALNAAIEAARAGEQGRGFAVVADEVRNLAVKTMNSTKQINAMVAEIQRETREAVASIENAKQEAEVSENHSLQVESSLATIVQAVEEIKTVITQIATASEEQATTATVIAGNLEEITRHG